VKPSKKVRVANRERQRKWRKENPWSYERAKKRDEEKRKAKKKGMTSLDTVDD
jgi:hypothetical protein